MKNEQESRERIAKIVRAETVKSNVIVAKTLIAFSVLCFLVWLTFQFGFLKSKGEFVIASLVVMPILFLTAGIVCLLRRGRGSAFPYVFLVLLTAFWFELELMSGYKTKLLLPLMIVLSLRFYNRRYTLFTYAAGVLALLGSVAANAFLYRDTGFIDLNLVSFEETRTVSLQGFLYNNIILENPDPHRLFVVGLRLSFFPNVIFLTVIMFFAIRFMYSNLQNIVRAEELATLEANRKIELSDIKTKAMLSQVKPHFIYNTLSSIACLCTDDPKRAKRLTMDFSEYLRNNLDTLNGNENSLCSFDEELEHVKCYLNIELVRFEDRLSVEYDIEALGFPIPALSIQPIVENAVKHGVAKKIEGGTVKISSREEEDCYVVTVEDDGVGFDETTAFNDGREHIGIANITKRIELYGGSFEIHGTPGVGTCATVKIPKTEEPV